MRVMLLIAATAAVVSCGHNYVKVDDMALGRVVVYRNGVAYFERRARCSRSALPVSAGRPLRYRTLAPCAAVDGPY